MPDNYTIKGDNTVLFGSAGFYTGSGIITRGSKKLTGEKLEIEDEEGNVVAVIYFNDKNEIQFEMIVKTAAPSLSRGDELTIASTITALLDDAEEVWERKQARMYRVTATDYVVNGAFSLGA